MNATTAELLAMVPKGKISPRDFSIAKTAQLLAVKTSGNLGFLLCMLRNLSSLAWASDASKDIKIIADRVFMANTSLLYDTPFHDKVMDLEKVHKLTVGLMGVGAPKRVNESAYAWDGPDPCADID